MYLPPQFKGKTEAHALPLMRSHPFASLISVDDEGLPFVTHLPLHLVPGDRKSGAEADASAKPADKTVGESAALSAAPSACEGEGADTPLVLLGHVAKPNPHWRYLQARPTAVATFLGPHAYMSPSVYPDLARVPTWNYVAVHCTVQARLVEGADAKDHLLKQLIADHEPAYAAQWRGLGEDFSLKMLAGIVGFELTITALQCKVKVNQHRPEAHDGMKAAYAAGNDHERELAQWMDRLGIPARLKET